MRKQSTTPLPEMPLPFHTVLLREGVPLAHELESRCAVQLLDAHLDVKRTVGRRTDHIWTVQDLLRYHVPPAPDAAPKRRGRPPKAKPEVVSGSRRRGRPPKPRPAQAAA
jgi:hypothetical protein